MQRGTIVGRFRLEVPIEAHGKAWRAVMDNNNNNNGGGDSAASTPTGGAFSGGVFPSLSSSSVGGGGLSRSVSGPASVSSSSSLTKKAGGATLIPRKYSVRIFPLNNERDQESNDEENNRKTIQQFQVGASLAALLKHPCIAKVCDAILMEDARCLCLVTEWAGDLSLEKHLLNLSSSSKVLGFEEVVIIATSIARALHHAHAMGVVHGNLNPSNVFIGDDRCVRVGGFGTPLVIARVAAEQDEAENYYQTQYMSPECVRGMAATNIFDLWGAGVILFRLMSGRHPVVAASVDELKRKIETERIADVQSVTNRELPSSLVQICNKILNFEIAQRFVSSYQLLRALRTAEYPQTENISSLSVSAAADDEDGKDSARRRSDVSFVKPSRESLGEDGALPTSTASPQQMQRAIGDAKRLISSPPPSVPGDGVSMSFNLSFETTRDTNAADGSKRHSWNGGGAALKSNVLPAAGDSGNRPFVVASKETPPLIPRALSSTVVGKDYGRMISEEKRIADIRRASSSPMSSPSHSVSSPTFSAAATSSPVPSMAAVSSSSPPVRVASSPKEATVATAIASSYVLGSSPNENGGSSSYVSRSPPSNKTNEQEQVHNRGFIVESQEERRRSSNNNRDAALLFPTNLADLTATTILGETQQSLDLTQDRQSVMSTPPRPQQQQQQVQQQQVQQQVQQQQRQELAQVVARDFVSRVSPAAVPSKTTTPSSITPTNALPPRHPNSRGSSPVPPLPASLAPQQQQQQQQQQQPPPQPAPTSNAPNVKTDAEVQKDLFYSFLSSSNLSPMSVTAIQKIVEGELDDASVVLSSSRLARRGGEILVKGLNFDGDKSDEAAEVANAVHPVQEQQQQQPARSSPPSSSPSSSTSATTTTYSRPVSVVRGFSTNSPPRGSPSPALSSEQNRPVVIAPPNQPQNVVVGWTTKTASPPPPSAKQEQQQLRSSPAVVNEEKKPSPAPYLSSPMNANIPSAVDNFASEPNQSVMSSPITSFVLPPISRLEPSPASIATVSSAPSGVMTVSSRVISSKVISGRIVEDTRVIPSSSSSTALVPSSRSVTTIPPLAIGTSSGGSVSGGGASNTPRVLSLKEIENMVAKASHVDMLPGTPTKERQPSSSLALVPSSSSTRSLASSLSTRSIGRSSSFSQQQQLPPPPPPVINKAPAARKIVYTESIGEKMGFSFCDICDEGSLRLCFAESAGNLQGLQMISSLDGRPLRHPPRGLVLSVSHDFQLGDDDAIVEMGGIFGGKHIKYDGLCVNSLFFRTERGRYLKIGGVASLIGQREPTPGYEKEGFPFSLKIPKNYSVCGIFGFASVDAVHAIGLVLAENSSGTGSASSSPTIPSSSTTTTTTNATVNSNYYNNNNNNNRVDDFASSSSSRRPSDIGNSVDAGSVVVRFAERQRKSSVCLEA